MTIRNFRDKESILFKLYYYPNNASLAPHFLLHHLNADYELLLVDKKSNSQKSADYLKAQSRRPNSNVSCKRTTNFRKSSYLHAYLRIAP
ncbi:hypothetical protein IFVP22_C1260002 [Vibrio parahaemolyticus]